MDDADCSDDKIDAFNAVGIERCRRALRQPQLIPVGVCHYCESTVAPGQLFCAVDEIDPDQSCAVQWEYERQRIQANRP